MPLAICHSPELPFCYFVVHLTPFHLTRHSVPCPAAQTRPSTVFPAYPRTSRIISPVPPLRLSSHPALLALPPATWQWSLQEHSPESMSLRGSTVPPPHLTGWLHSERSQKLKCLLRYATRSPVSWETHRDQALRPTPHNPLQGCIQ